MPEGTRRDTAKDRWRRDEKSQPGELNLKIAVEVKGGGLARSGWRVEVAFSHGSSGSAERKGRLPSDEGREEASDDAVLAQCVRDS